MGKTLAVLVLRLSALALFLALSSEVQYGLTAQGGLQERPGRTGGTPGEKPPEMDPSVLSKVGAVLAGNRVAQPPPRTRGNDLSALYWAHVRNVPVVVASDGTGSSVVIIVDTLNQKRHAWVITNYHVVEKPFVQKENPGQSFVFLLFYDDTLKNELFSADGFLQCWTSAANQTDWCKAVRNSTRGAWVVATDQSRDLALLSVYEPPSGVTGIPAEKVETLQPGDPVAVIGNPKGLLWSLTTGLVSQVRTKFPLGTGSGTMVQTQAPVNPGNSGGPLLGPDGNLAGVVYGARVGEMIDVGGEHIQVPADGLNYAIGIDQVLIFTRAHL